LDEDDFNYDAGQNAGGQTPLVLDCMQLVLISTESQFDHYSTFASIGKFKPSSSNHPSIR